MKYSDELPFIFEDFHRMVENRFDEKLKCLEQIMEQNTRLMHHKTILEQIGYDRNTNIMCLYS